METYSFRRVMIADLPILQRWLATASVRKWWVDANGQPADPMTPEDLDDPNVAMWIVSWQGEPFAYTQDYNPHA